MIQLDPTLRRSLTAFLSVLLILALAGCGPAGTPTPSPLPTATPEPTATPTPVATPTPEPTPTPTPVPVVAIDIKSLSGYVAPKAQSNGSYKKTFADGGTITWWVYGSGNKLVKGYQAETPVVFGPSSDFTVVEGVLTFRGNNYRDAPAWGSADVLNKKLTIVWEKTIGAVSGTGSYWPGSGWTGQPLIVHWPEETREAMGLSAEAKAKDLVEVVYPVFDGKIYFLDLETGLPTRDPIKVGFSFKGTGSVDPRGWPFFYAGQGLNDTNGTIGAFFYRMFDLVRNEQVYGIPGLDPVTSRAWGAFDSSSLIDAKTGILFEPGENGVLYRTDLHAAFDATAGTASLAPEIVKMNYRVSYPSYYGIESSAVGYRNLVYTSDNGGLVLCTDINSMEPVWMFWTKDDSDATMVLEETADGPVLYQGNTVDKRPSKQGTTGDDCNLRKFDALTGKVLWQYDVHCVYDSVLNGGLLATPLVGKDDISDLVIYNIAKTTARYAGTLLALDKATGKPVWTRKLDAYSWSSPIAIKGKDGKSYGIFCDYKGDMHLFDPRTGEDLDVISLGLNVESSPSAYDDMIVVGSYAKKIFGIRID